MTENVPALASIPTDHEMTVFNVMAKQAVQSKFYKTIGDESAVMMIMLSARELNIPPVMALNGGIRMINGVMELSARAMNMMIRRAGHSIQVQDESNTQCILVGKRKDNGDVLKVSYTIQEAHAAKLVKEGGAWTKIPKDMLFARALSRLARRLFADVIGNAYIEGEVSDPTGSSISNTYVQHMDDISVEVLKSPEVEVQNVEDIFIEFMKTRDPADENLWREFINVVGQHYSWNFHETIEEFTKDELTDSKFVVWKSKKQKPV